MLLLNMPFLFLKYLLNEFKFLCDIVNYAVFTQIKFVLYFVGGCSSLIINVHLLIIAVDYGNSVCDLFICAHFKPAI